MKVPSGHMAVIDREKITDYLLNPVHPDNGGKAVFFQSLGFSGENWTTLSAAFRKLVEITEVTKSVESPHGWKYILDGPIDPPSGKSPLVRTIWIVDRGQNAPRLVTAYPCEE